jgi:hypothetical protein
VYKFLHRYATHWAQVPIDQKRVEAKIEKAGFKGRTDVTDKEFKEAVKAGHFDLVS